MQLVIISPIPLPFKERLGFKYKSARSYADAWRSVERSHPSVALPALSGRAVPIEYPRKTDRGLASRYSDSQASSLDFPLESVVVGIPLELSKLSGPAAGPYTLEPISAEIRLYEHGIGLLRASLEVAPAPDGPAFAAAEHAKILEEQVAAAGDALCRIAIEHVIAPLLAEIGNSAEEAGLLSVPVDLKLLERAVPLWNSRCLAVADGDESMADFLVGWLGDSISEPEEVADLLSPASPTRHIARWLNYTYVVDPDVLRRPAELTASLDEQLGSMLYSQYFYASLEVCDDFLLEVLGESYQGLSGSRLGVLQSTLSETSERARMALFEHYRTMKLFDRKTRAEVEEILAYWRTEEALMDPVREKSAAAREKLKELSERRRERSDLGTDIILLGIGVTSILATLVALTEYGRSLATDPTLSGYNRGASRIMYWISGQATDGIIVVSLAVSAVLVLLFIFFRSRGR